MKKLLALLLTLASAPALAQPAPSIASGSPFGALAILNTLPLSLIAPIPNNSFIGNNTGATAGPVALGPTALLDMISTTQGSLLYRPTGGWTVLAKNTTATRYLSNTGISNDPAWAQVDLSNGVTGTVQAANTAALTGDVTKTAGANNTVLTNIPANTTQAGTIISIAAATPGNPATGRVAVYGDSTSLTYAAVNSLGAKTSMAAGATCSAGQLFSAFSVANASFTCLDISATQANQETATSTTVYVTSGRQQYHPSANKAWVYWTVSGTTPTVQSSYNVTSVVRNGVGDYTITFTNAFSASTAYAAVCNTYSPGINTGQIGMIAGSRTTSVFRAFTGDNAGGAKDNTENNCIFTGDLP